MNTNSIDLNHAGHVHVEEYNKFQYIVDFCQSSAEIKWKRILLNQHLKKRPAHKLHMR